MKFSWILNREQVRLKPGATSAIVVMLAAVPPIHAQTIKPPEMSRVEAAGTMIVPLTSGSGTLASTYSPPLLFDGPFTSAASQTLTFDQHKTPGVNGGVNFFIAPRAGIQILLGRVSAGLSGPNTPYTYRLTYTSRLPPNDQLQLVDVQNTVPWPDTSGSLADLSTSVNAVGRAGGRGRTSVTFSGGATFHRVSGTVRPLAFTAFQLGGHSVLFTSNYRLAVRLNPATAVGFNLGGEVNVALHQHVALTLGYRYFGAPTLHLTARPSGVLNPEEVTFEQSLADIAGQLALGSATVSLSSSQILVGVKFVR